MKTALFLTLFTVPESFIDAWVVRVAWNWPLHRALGISPITLLQSFGLMVFFSIFITPLFIAIGGMQKEVPSGVQIASRKVLKYILFALVFGIYWIAERLLGN